MAWTDIARREHNRDSARYPSDLMAGVSEARKQIYFNNLLKYFDY